jgi:hypothetical protein
MSLSKAELTSKTEIEAMQPDEFARTRKKGKGYDDEVTEKYRCIK